MGFKWDCSTKRWAQRQERSCIGRLPFVHPNSGERYYLQMLLTKVYGAEYLEDIRTLDGVIHPTFRSACQALRLLDDDNEWHETLSEASNWAFISQLRNMFCSILMFSEVSDPKQLWEQHWGELTDDLERMMQRQTRNPNLRLTPEEMQIQGLQEIEHILNKLGRSLTNFPDIPQPSSELERNTLNRLIRDELEYDTHDEANKFDTLARGLNTDQYRVYAAILDAHSRDVGGLFFIYGSGGTGKTYLWNTLIAEFRSKRKIVLYVASSGIAALLLPGGKTAHSTFKIPFDPDQHSVCNFKKDSTRTDLICKLVVLGGYFRQILPAVPDEGREFIVAATLHQAFFWRDCQVMCLRINMRLCRSDVPSKTLEQILEFADWIIKVGEGDIARVPITEEDEPNWIEIPRHPNHCLELKVGAPGDEVQITLFNADIDKYKEILKQGKVYSIAQLELMPLDTSYKNANNQMRLKFGNKTMITEFLDDCDDIPMYNFRLFINPDIDETDDLHGWYADDGYVQKHIRSQILANSISEMEMVFNAKRIELNQFSAAHNELGDYFLEEYMSEHLMNTFTFILHVPEIENDDIIVVSVLQVRWEEEFYYLKREMRGQSN
uniref:ATP-dependent DNA helicase n=1 Tax=Chenopodium quinoa TaxID=63459 RepID=A0A803MUL1_CHEQI